jgi:hypothetical protein
VIVSIGCKRAAVDASGSRGEEAAEVGFVCEYDGVRARIARSHARTSRRRGCRLVLKPHLWHRQCHERDRDRERKRAKILCEWNRAQHVIKKLD